MTTKFQKVSKHSRIKTVRETTETIEHKCTAACFRPERRRPKPKGLRRVNLGYVYVAPDGKCYSKAGLGNWTQVLGLAFAWSIEGFTLMWEPAEQFHIHSRGGKTIGKIVDDKEIRPDEIITLLRLRRRQKRKANRHEVLHGISLDYGTKRNGLKAISLLGHLATIVHDVVEEYEATSPSPSS